MEVDIIWDLSIIVCYRCTTPLSYLLSSKTFNIMLCKAKYQITFFLQTLCFSYNSLIINWFWLSLITCRLWNTFIVCVYVGNKCLHFFVLLFHFKNRIKKRCMQSEDDDWRKFCCFIKKKTFFHLILVFSIVCLIPLKVGFLSFCWILYNCIFL